MIYHKLWDERKTQGGICQLTFKQFSKVNYSFRVIIKTQFYTIRYSLLPFPLFLLFIDGTEFMSEILNFNNETVEIKLLMKN